MEEIFKDLDEDGDGEVDRDEFVELIIMVLEKMLDNEKGLIASFDE